MLAGHAAAERQLRTAFESGRLAHAWLITGPRGVGKATLAFRFARFVLNGGAPAAEMDMFGAPGDLSSALPDGLFADPGCSLFRRVASGGHSDLFTVERRLDPKKGRLYSEIRGEDVREIGPFLFTTAAEGGWRVVVIDCADEMNRHAANAVLKVLEEPPKKALLLLVCHAPGRLLETIRSRCRKLALIPLSDTDVAGLVALYKPDIQPADANRLAHLAGGSIGHALGLADLGGLALYSSLMHLLTSLPALDTVALHRLGDAVGKSDSSETFKTVTDLYRAWLGRLIRYAAAGEPAGNPRNAAELTEERELLRRLAPAAPLDRWLEVWEKTNGLLARVDSANMDRKQVLLTLFLDLADASQFRSR
jgi:DNA polymerase-3 subunit delta'